MPDIGLRLKELRKRHKLSLLELSKLTKMSYSFLSGLENGKHSITIANLQKLAEFFGVDLVYFLQENDNDSKQSCTQCYPLSFDLINYDKDKHCNKYRCSKNLS